MTRLQHPPPSQPRLILYVALSHTPPPRMLMVTGAILTLWGWGPEGKLRGEEDSSRLKSQHLCRVIH